jgi:hypothetical protein
MNHLENEYKKRFINQDQNIDGFDESDLWESIAQDLDAMPVQKERKPISWWIILAIISVGFFFVYLGINEQNEEQYSKEEMIASKPLETKNKKYSGQIQNDPQGDFKEKGINQSIPAENSVPKSFDINEEAIPVVEYKVTDQGIPSHDLNPLKVIQDRKEAILNKENKEMLRQNISSDNEPDFISNNSLKEWANKETEKTDEQNLQRNNLLQVETLPLKPIIKITQNKNKFGNIEELNLNLQDKNSRPLTVGVTFGSNWNSIDFFSKEWSEVADLKSNLEKGRVGFNYGLNLTMDVRRNSFFGIGFDINNLTTKFEYTQERSIPIVRENQLLKVWINTNSGDTLKTLYGDTTVYGEYRRHVLHYNQYTFWTIPISYGFKRSFERWSTGVSFGVEINMLKQQKWRSIDENDEFIHFNGSSESKPYSSINIGFRISIPLAYQMNERWAIKILPTVSWKNLGYNSTNVFRASLFQYSVNGGIGFTL